MGYRHIALEHAGAVATLRLARAQALNALRPDMLDEMLHAIDDVVDGGQARVLRLTGAGRAFCVGADISGGEGGVELFKDAGRILDAQMNPLIERLLALPIPLVCAVNGVAAGAGCALALAGDIVVAARSAYFLQAFVNIGLVPDAGSTWMLPRLVGKARAQALMMLGDRLPADQALDWGMIYAVVQDAELEATSAGLAQRLAEGPTVAYGLIRRGLRESLDQTLTQALAVERRHQRLAGRTEDAREGVTAFKEKRPAQFVGR